MLTGLGYNMTLVFRIFSMKIVLWLNQFKIKLIKNAKFAKLVLEKIRMGFARSSLQVVVWMMVLFFSKDFRFTI